MVEAAAARMCSVDGLRRAELECSVLEEDWQRGQSYTAQWHSLTPVPEHQHGSVTAGVLHVNRLFDICKSSNGVNVVIAPNCD